MANVEGCLKGGPVFFERKSLHLSSIKAKEGKSMNDVVVQEAVEQKIYLIRGRRAMLDEDLSKLYGVSTKRLNEQVKRNAKRFPPDFMFPLKKQEVVNLRSQIATSRWGGRRYIFNAFTEQGIAMLSSVLNSERAIQVNIIIMRVFVKLRELVATHKEILNKLNELETKVGKHDEQIAAIFQVIRQLVEPQPQKPKRRMGFHSD